MKTTKSALFLSADPGLILQWTRSLGTSLTGPSKPMNPLADIDVGCGLVWLDLSTPHLPAWSNPIWHTVLHKMQIQVIAASSSPTDDEGMLALDAGCSAYCHAFSDAVTLKRVREVVSAGNVWIGKSLMSRLLKNTVKVTEKLGVSKPNWSDGLTPREIEVANLAAHGASNQSIADQCHITERTVKAHLSAVFEKLHVADRLQLALLVHGIR
jgi:DNA-binding NarL/FixJ family response regulator